MKITLKDIAQKTGYSINTVSRALKDKDDIAEETKSIIKQAAKEMGYIPNNIASGLRSGLSKTIAVILGDISNPYFSILAKHIEIAARKYGYTIFVLNTDERYELEEQAIYTAMSKGVDGIILFPTQKKDEDIKLLKKSNMPFVIVGRYFKEWEDTDYLVADDIKGGYLATEYLIKNDRKRILLLEGPDYLSSSQEREEGYRRALADNGIEFDSKLVKRVSILAGRSYSAMKKIIDQGIDFSGIFAFSDVIAWEAIYALEDAGLKVPDDVGVVGYDNIQSQLFFPWPLTTINISKRKMAHKAVDILMKRINGQNNGKYYHEVFDTKLIVRKSC
jgi:LacI family transcriptional regulator